MASSNNFSRFLVWTGAATAAGIAACIALVVVIDPYGLYRLVDIQGLNHIKPQPDRYREEIKLNGARATKANVLIVGNSRAEIGFDPAYPGLAESGQSTYNLALAGRTIQAAREQLEYLQRIGQRPVKLIVGVDFLDFLIDPRTVPPAPVSRNPPVEARQQWKFDALFSLASVTDSLRTIGMQNAHEAETITARGFNPLWQYYKFARDDGYYPLFQQRAVEYASRFVKAPHGLVANATGSSADIDNLRAILTEAAQAKTEVYVVIYPYHSQILAMFDEVGLQPVFEQWKTMLTSQIDAIHATYPDAHIALWDFSGYSAFQCEPIPAKGDKKQQTRWYWEAGHFKPALGDIMLARMLNGAQPSAEGAIGFQLSSSGLAENRRRFMRERDACEASNPALFKDAAALIAKSRGRQ